MSHRGKSDHDSESSADTLDWTGGDLALPARADGVGGVTDVEPGRHADRGAPRPPATPPSSSPGLPPWLTAIVVLVLLALLAWNIVKVGPDGIGTTYVLGGLLGAYAGVDQLLKRRPPGDGDRS